jgi:hypothetical protein
VYARTLLDRPLATPLPVVLFVARSDGRSFASGRERRPTLALGGGGGATFALAPRREEGVSAPSRTIIHVGLLTPARVPFLDQSGEGRSSKGSVGGQFWPRGSNFPNNTHTTPKQNTKHMLVDCEYTMNHGGAGVPRPP